MPYIILLLLTSLFWGGNFVVSEITFRTRFSHDLNNYSLDYCSYLPYSACMVERKKDSSTTLRPLPLFLMGFTGAFLFNILQFFALERTTAMNVGLISTLNAISIAIFSFIFLKEKINSYKYFPCYFHLLV